jgi:branched-subunit amino acid ABC-type transport system permease component
MGIDNRRIFAVAMGIAMVVTTVAALYLGIRANFDPSIGPARLIYAFEAVIIGGLGSLWGTLAAASSSASRRPSARISIPNGRFWRVMWRFSSS